MILDPHIQPVPQATLSKSEKKQVRKKPNWLGHSWQKAISQKAFRAALSMSAPASEVNRVIELGCGRGAFFSELIERYPEAFLIGIELNQYALNEARLRLRSRKGHWLLLHSAPQRLNMPSASADLIHVHYLLHRLPHWNQVDVITEAARVLKPGGKILISDFCDSGYWTRALWKSLKGDRKWNMEENCGWCKELSALGLQVKRQKKISQNSINSYVLEAEKGAL